MLKLRVTPKAELDLIGIWVYTCYTHVFPGYRRLQVEHHAVFYQVVEPEVIVVRVLHEDMDAPERLVD